jgi:hypothetical protein
MQQQDIDRLRARVSCATVLEQAGFALDLRESSRRALKYRRAAEIIIVTHAGYGWFDPLSDRKGDVFALVRALHGCGFRDAALRLSGLAHIAPFGAASGLRSAPRRVCAPLLGERWARRPALAEGNPSWTYLNRTRSLPNAVLDAARRQDIVRCGPHASLWAKHVDADGDLTGWEERGPLWRGFSAGGAKQLFRFGTRTALRVCVSEAAIDAMSLAALEDIRADTLYVSTAGGWAPATVRALERLAAKAQTQLVAATDNDVQGDAFADNLRQMANALGCDFRRLKPRAQDWNAEWSEIGDKRT